MLRRFAAFLFLIFVSSASQAEWREARSANFIVYGNVSEATLRDFSIRLERFDAGLRPFFKVPSGRDSNPLTVLVAPSQQAVIRLLGGGSTAAAGFYSGNSGGSFAVVQRPEVRASMLDLDAVTILYHEYAHHFMRQYFPAAYPPWFVEGFAELVSTMEFDRAGKAKIGEPSMHRLVGLVLDAKLPMERLLSNDVRGLKGSELTDFYGRSWLLTHFLYMSNNDRRVQLTEYLDAVSRGVSSTQAAATFGDLKKLSKDLDYYFRKGTYPTLTLVSPIPAPKEIAVRTLRPGEAQLAEDRLVYMRGIPDKSVEAFGKKTEAVAATYPDDPYVLELLAAGRFARKDYAGAVKAADRLLALAPSNSRAMLWKGKAMLEQVAAKEGAAEADWKAARAWIVKANRADGNDPLAYVAFFDSFARSGQKPPAIAIEGLQRALDLAPQDDDLRAQLAFQYAAESKFDFAAYTIRPLAYSPHQGAGVEQARRMLDAFEQKRMPDLAQSAEGTAVGSPR